jgi:hypothetical protein
VVPAPRRVTGDAETKKRGGGRCGWPAGPACKWHRWWYVIVGPRWAQRPGRPADYACLRTMRDGGDPVDFNNSVKAQVAKGAFLFQALSTNDSNSNLEFKFESHTNKIQIKPIKLQSFHTSIYYS